MAQLIRFAGVKVIAPGQTCSQTGALGQAGGKVWKSTSGHRGSGEDAIGYSHGVSERRTDFTCIDCFAPLGCRPATYWQERGVLKPASNLLSPCMPMARLGRRDMLTKNAILHRNTLGGVFSYCMRDKNDFGKHKCAHVSL